MRAFSRTFAVATATVVSACLYGCGGGTTPSPQPTVVAPAAVTTIYSMGFPTSQTTLFGYPVTASGVVSSTTQITLPSNETGLDMATGKDGSLYVASQIAGTPPTNVVHVYTSNSSGVPTLARTLNLPSNIFPYNMDTDNAGRLYMGSGTDGFTPVVVTIFAAGASGSAAPLQTISLPSMSYLTNVAVDPSGAQMYVVGELKGVTGTQIVTFSASGNGTPVQSLNVIGGTLSATVDASGNLYALTPVVTGSQQVITVQEFAAGAGGNATPIRSLPLPPPVPANPLQIQELAGLDTVRLDTSGNIYAGVMYEVYGTLGGSSVITYTATPSVIYKFAANAASNSAPVLMLQPTLGDVQSIAPFL